MTFYYTIYPDISKMENYISVYKIEDDYPFVIESILLPFSSTLREELQDYLIEQGYENFEISRL